MCFDSIITKIIHRVWSRLYIFLRSFDLLITWFWQRKEKWVAVSGSEPQLHIGFIVYRILCLNFCSFRWLIFSLKRVSNLMPWLSWIAKTRFLEVLTKLSNAFLNDIVEGNDFMSSFKLFHFWEQREKYELLKLAAFQAVCFRIFFAADLVWWIGLLWSLRYDVKYLAKVLSQFYKRKTVSA